jgi:hypothetical protein
MEDVLHQHELPYDPTFAGMTDHGFSYEKLVDNVLVLLC